MKLHDIALVMLLGLAAAPAGDLGEVARELGGRIKSKLPEGWAIEVKQNIVTIARRKPVEWYGTVGLPEHRDKAELKAMGFIHSSTYTITVTLVRPMTPEGIARLAAENERVLKDYYREHPADPRAKPVALPQEVTDKLHPIPSIVTAQYGAIVDPSIKGWLAFFDDEEQNECGKVEVLVREILSAGLPATRPTTQPQAGRHGFKGWELYVWQKDAVTFYHLLPGTNRLKADHMIAEGATTELEAIKRQFDNLRRGEYVYLIDRTLAERPPAAAVGELLGYCRSKGLEAHVQR